MRVRQSRLRMLAVASAIVLCGGALVGCKGDDTSQGAVLVIETAPDPGADVLIGDKYYGRTPVTIRDLAAGQYYAILELYGFKRTTQMISLPAEGEHRVTIELRPIVGYFTLESEPPGAQVFLGNGSSIGTTPLVEKAVPTGILAYELRLDNYLPLQGSIEIKEDYKYSRTHVLDPLRGSVRVFSRPTGSQIYINDVLQSDITPASFQLAPGTYTIGAYHEGYLMGEKSVVVEPNSEQVAELDLKEGYMPPGMVLVPAGEFIMGVDNAAPDERPRRKVFVEAFYIDKFEVTNKQFAAVFPTHRYDERKVDHPVTGVSWDQATEFARRIGKRLPTEEEWEKAARGTDGRLYPWGNTWDPKLCVSAKAPPDVSSTARIGQSRAGASPYGLLDMAGNAYEWTSSWYQPYPGNTDVSDKYGQVYRVLRGGSYLTDDFGVRAPRRHYDKIDQRREDYGFRCAMDAAVGAKPPAATAKP